MCKTVKSLRYEVLKHIQSASFCNKRSVVLHAWRQQSLADRLGREESGSKVGYSVLYQSQVRDLNLSARKTMA